MTSSSPISTALTTASPFLLAVFGYITTAVHTLRTTQHEARVARVGAQLKELYGPLLACVSATKSAYDAMVRQHAAAAGGVVAGLQGAAAATHFRDAVRADSHGAAAEAYRTWVRVVLMPLSERAMKTVIEHADLLESTTIEPLLLQLVAHVSAYRVILRRWEEGALAEGSHISYPDGVHAWASEQFRRLKRRQAELLGVDKDGRQGSFLMRLLVSRL